MTDFQEFEHCADCGKQLKCQPAEDGHPRYCIRCFKARQARPQQQPATLDEFIRELREGKFDKWLEGSN